MTSAMRAKRFKVVLPMLVLGGFTGSSAILLNTPTEIEKQASNRDPPLIETMFADRKALQLNVHSRGVVAPRTEMNLTSEVTGRVVEVHPAFAAGGFFEKGETLVRIDSRDYDFAVVRARAQVAEARKELFREEAEAEHARQEWQVLGSGTPSPYALHEPQLKERRAKLQAAEAGLVEARLNRARCVLRAPFTGRVRDKRVDIGQYVKAGETLAGLYATDALEVRLPVPPDQIDLLNLPLYPHTNPDAQRHQPKVKLTARFGATLHEWHGTIVRTEAAVDEKTGMFYVVARVTDPFGEQPQGIPLTVGLFVHAEIEGIVGDGLIKLDNRALHSGYQVYIVDQDARLRLRTVEVLRREADGIVVRGGLNPGERVMVGGIELPVEGMRVTVEAQHRDHLATGSEQAFSR